MKFWAESPPSTSEPIAREQGFYRFGDMVRFDAEVTHHDVVHVTPSGVSG